MGLEASESQDGTERSLRGIAPLVVVAIVFLLLILFLPFANSSLLVVFLAFVLVFLSLWERVKRYRRLILLVIVPWLLVTDLVATFLNEAMNSIEAASLMRSAFIRFLAGGSVGRSILSIVIGLLAGTLAVWFIQETYIFYNKDLLMSVTGADAATTRRALRALFLNLQRAHLMVENGKSTITKPAGVMSHIGGPGMVIIQPGNAVVFERSGRITAVELNGAYHTKKFEHIRKIVQLTNRDNIVASSLSESSATQKKHWSAPNVWTRDQIILNIDFQVSFHIKRKPLVMGEANPEQSVSFTADPARPANIEPYRVDKRDVYQAAFAANDWEVAVPAIALRHLRDVVGQRKLDELFEPGQDNAPVLRGDVCSIVRDRTAADVANLGVTVSQVTVGEVQMPPEVKMELQARWLAVVHEDVVKVQNDTERDMLIEISKVLRTYGEHGISAKEMLERLRFIEAMSKMAEDPSSKLVIPHGFFAGMEGTGLLGNRSGGASTNGPARERERDTSAETDDEFKAAVRADWPRAALGRQSFPDRYITATPG